MLTAQEILKLRKPDEFHIKIELGYDEKIYDFEKDVSCYINVPTKYVYTVYTNKDDKFQNIISDKENFENAIIENNETIRDVYADCDEEEIELKLTKDMDFDKFFSNDYTVTILGEPEEIIEYLNNNKIESNKIIVSKSDGESINIDDEELLNNFILNINNLDNIYIKGQGNEEDVCIEDYKKTIQYIDEIVNKVRKIDLSPMEKLMYTYDIVRDRKYNMESEDEDYSVSRDLTSVTQGDKIVCLGFAKVYDMILKKLGFNSMVHLLMPQEEDKHGHARNMVYVKDRKYDIDGIYFFDPTYDSKRKDDYSHFDHYSNFARTYDHFARKEKLYNNFMLDLDRVYMKILKNETDTITRNEMSSVNYLYNEMYNNTLLNPIQLMIFNQKDESLSPMARHFIEKDNYNKEKLYKDIEKFREKYNNPISLENFMKILTNVRKQEYYENSEKFPLSVEKILEISKTYGGNKADMVSKLFLAIFGNECNQEEDIMEECELDKDINRVRVAKSLRKVLEMKNRK